MGLFKQERDNIQPEKGNFQVRSKAVKMVLRCICIFVQIARLVHGVPQGQYFITEPEDVIGIAGDHLMLSCVVGNMEGRCMWTKDGFGFGTNPVIPDYPRITMDIDKPGDCKLKIFPVLPEDEGVYKCQVGAVSGVEAIVSESAKVAVICPPGQPYIKQAKAGDTLEVLEGEEVVLDCETTGAKPAAQVEWNDQNGRKILVNLMETVHKNVVSKTFRTISTLKMKPKEDTSLTCSAFSDSFKEPRISRKLDVKIKHSPRLSLNTITEAIEAGNIVVKCASDAYPPIVTYRWFVNDEEKEETSDTLIIENVAKELNNAVLQCEAENSVGKTKVSTMLKVMFVPRILTHPTTEVAKHGDRVKFTCSAEGNPEPHYVWVKGRSQEVVGVSKHLILTATEETEDDYNCKVFVDGEQTLISDTASLKILRKPEVFTESVKLAKMEEDVILQCRVHSLSHNTEVSWTKDNQPIDQDSSKHRILFTDGHYQFASDLIVYKVEKSDFTNYGCFSTNEVGTDYKIIPLEEEAEEYDFVAITLTINSVVGILLLVCIVIYHKRKNRMQEGHEEDDRQGRRNVGRDDLPPIYRREGESVIQELLLDRRMHEDYHENISDNFDKQFFGKK